MLSELSFHEFDELVTEMVEHEIEMKKMKKTYCTAITTKDVRCKNYAWSKCKQQFCYSHRKLDGPERLCDCRLKAIINHSGKWVCYTHLKEAIAREDAESLE
jgi:hypothetical protein